MKQLEIKPLRFGLKYANDEVVSSKQLQAENKLLEEKVNQLKKIIEDDHKKTEERRIEGKRAAKIVPYARNKDQRFLSFNP
jgi:hypothetical protein